MAEEEIEISELEFEEDLVGDLVFPVESASDTKATSLTVLKNWLKQFFVGLTDNETITGLKNFSNDGQASDNAQLELTATNIDASSAPASSKYAGINVYDKDGIRIGKFGYAQSSDGSFETTINAINLDGNTGQIAVRVAPDGTVSTRAPTPASSDNTNKIATTAFVKSVLSSSGNGLATISKSGNGYCKFTNGLIIQWGRDIGGGTVTFPTPFTSSSSFSIANAYSGSGVGDHFYGVINSVTRTGFKWVKYGSESLEYWLAIGY